MRDGNILDFSIKFSNEFLESLGTFELSVETKASVRSLILLSFYITYIF